MKTIETSDLFRGSYLICAGGHLDQVKLIREQRVCFVIEGESLEDEDLSYRSGEALVNPLQFREVMNLLRDQIRKTQNPKKGKQYGQKRYRANQAKR